MSSSITVAYKKITTKIKQFFITSRSLLFQSDLNYILDSMRSFFLLSIHEDPVTTILKKKEWADDLILIRSLAVPTEATIDNNTITSIILKMFRRSTFKLVTVKPPILFTSRFRILHIQDTKY